FVASIAGSQLKLAATVGGLPSDSVVDLSVLWDGAPLAMRSMTVDRSACGTLGSGDCLNLRVKFAGIAGFATNKYRGTPLAPQGRQNIGLLPLRDRMIAMDGVLDSLGIDNRMVNMHLKLELARVQ